MERPGSLAYRMKESLGTASADKWSTFCRSRLEGARVEWKKPQDSTQRSFLYPTDLRDILFLQKELETFKKV